ncbi:hypothetical protein BWQ96_06346 [Gracilariopsis chorda]|uniref:Uncharacterized protein n=1 Tax=Gracilariopsis chorda TaxID=448386 RepID=A0A2V3IRY1_9FLOR|nr:hypothetical protein BWQ96_06346 [Gracilariopsis chorda]|eukprot:PXF43880.1 hypothetical protein BWQ96_06346 [Gracilariopsis chorda]
MARWTTCVTTRPLSIQLAPPRPDPVLPLPESSPSTIEIAGLEAVVIVSFTNRGLRSAKAVFPTRMANPTHPRGYLQTSLHFDIHISPSFVRYDGVSVSFVVEGEEAVTQSIYASPSQPVVYSNYTYAKPQVSAELVRKSSMSKLPRQGDYDLYRHEVWISGTCLQIKYTCLQSHPLSAAFADLALRKNLIYDWTSPVSLQCPESSISLMIHFAKIRAQESIFKAPKLGLVHSPGGDMFYSGVWCNDQAEYAAPALAFLGAPKSRAREAAINSVLALGKHFDYQSESIPYSVEIDGGYVGRLDRGDAAMFAWGASLLALTIAEENVTARLFPLISFACGILYNKLAQSQSGVIPSQSDELEGRFPTGEENLSTNCLTILAFETAAQVAVEAKDPLLEQEYKASASTLRLNAHRYFACGGERKYAYYKGCPDARGWACLAALAGLPDGQQALEYCLSEMWCDDGVLVSSSNTAVWDRTTLYAIRAAYRCGLVDVATEKLRQYAKKRFTEGPAAPYAVENNDSWAQLAAESALFVRVILEGLLGIEVISDRRLLFTPRSPTSWPSYVVDKVHFADVSLTFRVNVVDDSTYVEVESDSGSCNTEFKDGHLLLRVPRPPTPPELTHLTLQQYATCRMMTLDR